MHSDSSKTSNTMGFQLSHILKFCFLSDALNSGHLDDICSSSFRGSPQTLDDPKALFVQYGSDETRIVPGTTDSCFRLAGISNLEQNDLNHGISREKGHRTSVFTTYLTIRANFHHAMVIRTRLHGSTFGEIGVTFFRHSVQSFGARTFLV